MPATFLTLAVSAGLVWTARASWLAGLWLAFGWISVNAYLLNRIFVEAGSGKAPDPRRIYIVLIVKFPVLYIIGLALLVFRWVRLEAAAAAFSAYLAATILCALRPRVLRDKQA